MGEPQNIDKAPRFQPVGRLRDEVGFTPARDLDAGLAETVAWWRARSRVQVFQRKTACDSDDSRRFVRRDAVPVHQNALMTTRQKARRAARGTLTLAVCGRCGFIHNQTFEPERLSYGAAYDNAQTHSAAFRDYVDGLADHLLSDRGVRGCRIVEIGCGDGYFLRRLVDDATAGNAGVGFDPSYSGPDTDPDMDNGDRLRFERRFFDADCADVAADVVVCRHVIEHVPDPVAMLNAVRQALARSPHARVYFETPCVEWILAENAIWDLFYEHCSYFTAVSLAAAFEVAGFTVSGVEHVFGGQYLWLEARLPGPVVAAPLDGGSLPRDAARFGVEEAAMLSRLETQLGAIAGSRRVAIWGAGAKGATLANLLDPERRLFDSLIDINPNKQGCFVAGSGHEIVSLAEALRRGVAVAVLMNPNYRPEIEAMVRKAGATLELMDVA